MSDHDFISVGVELIPVRVSARRTLGGPWIPILDEELEDSRHLADPLPLQTFYLTEQTTSQYIKFELLSWWGDGGGLQFFDIWRKGKGYYFHVEDS